MGKMTSGSKAIADVLCFPLKRIGDERGAVLHMLRSDDPHFTTFGEAYFSIVCPGAVKAWKRHRLMTQNLAVPVGSIRLAIYDDRPGSLSCGAIEVIETGAADYRLIRIPPLLWYGFAGLGETESLIANCADMPHDPAEVDRLPADTQTIPYRW